MDTLAQRIKDERAKIGITQQQLAFDTGLSVAGIQSIETGRAKPNIDTLSKLADRFVCSTDYLLGRSKFRNPRIQEQYESWDSVHKSLKVATEYMGIFKEERKEKIKKMIENFPGPESETIPTFEDKDTVDEILIEVLAGFEEFKEKVRIAQEEREEREKTKKK